MSARFTISIIIALSCAAAGGAALAGSPCDEAKALRRERLAFDVEMRKKRVDLKRQSLDLRAKVNELDRRMTAIEEDILNSEEGRAESLWRDYDDLDEQRNAIWPKIKEIEKQSTEISSRRAAGKLEMKLKRLEKRYECVLNDDLAGKMDYVLRRAGKDKGSGDRDVQALAALVAERKAWAQALAAEYATRRKAIDDLTRQVRQGRELLDRTAKEEERLDEAQELLSDQLDKALDEISDALDTAGDRMSEIAKNILPAIERLGAGGGR